MTLGRPRLHLRSTGSTNERARELALAGAPHGTVVTAGEQTAGRGRQGRGWSTPPGTALALSLVIRDPDPLLSLRAGLAVADLAGPARAGQVAQRRAARRPQGRRRARRGPPAGGLGRPRHRRQRGARSRAAAGGAARHAPGRSGCTRASSRARWPTCSPRSRRGSTRPRRPCWRRCASATRSPGSRVRWEGGSGTGAGIGDDGALRVRDAAGTEHVLAAGEVHLGRARRSRPGRGRAPRRAPRARRP